MSLALAELCCQHSYTRAIPQGYQLPVMVSRKCPRTVIWPLQAVVRLLLHRAMAQP